MRLLLVENSPSDAGIMVAACGQLGNVDLDVAESLQAANDLIERRHGEYDLAIFDLQIPTTDQALDEHVDHGLSAFVRLGRLAPGTIRFVWSGKATDEAWEQIVDEQNKADPLGANEQESMVRFFKKEKFRDCITCLTEISDAMSVLDAMQWSWGLDPQPIASMTRRVIDIFARRQNGVIIHACALGDGLSDASVFRLEIKAESGATTASVVGKVANVDAVRDELARYSRHVAAALNPGTYASLSDEVLVGADGLGGAFYSLVDPNARSLFEIASEDPERAATAVDRLAEKLGPWRQGAPQKRVSVGDIRRDTLPDELLDSLGMELAFDREAVESGDVFVKESVIHGDLHGQNVLVDGQAEPILIDYAEVRRGAAALDPVTLELSAMLHPKSPLKGLWEGAEPALWMKSSDFFAQSPYRPFFLSLRKWAHDVAASDGEVCAAAYAYCIRQLKYDDVDKDLAAQLAAAAAASLP
jgi:hypothetical protein